jgi:hypothetical protein
MGFDGIYSVYHYNKDTQEYEKLALYDKDGKELYDFFPTRDGMLNQLLLGYNRHGFDFDAIDARRGMPDWYSDQDSEGTYYDYLELKGWAQGNVCEYPDWMADYDEDDEPPKRNALKDFMQLVSIYIELYHIWYPKPGEIIIVCEMSY